VSTLDLVMIQRHILGLQELDSPYKIIAGDVTNDEKLSASDLLALRKLILGITNDFNNKSWRFVNGAYDFPDPIDPFPYEEEVEIRDLMSNINDADLYIEFSAAEDGIVYGFQFGAENTGFDIKGLQRGLLDVTPNMIRTGGKKLRMSWSSESGVPVFEGQVLFRIVADAANDLATLSILSDDIVSPEIYIDALEISNLSFEWRSDNSTASATKWRRI